MQEVIETINMLLGGDIYQLPYETIKNVFMNHSREARNKVRASQSTTNTPSSSTSIKHEIGNMLEDFKSDMLHTFSLQMDTMQIKRKQKEPWLYFSLYVLENTLEMNVH